MEMIRSFQYIIVVLYVVLLALLFPKSGTTYDLFKLRLRLYPFWMKFVSLGVILIFIILILVFDVCSAEWESCLIAVINLNLFVLVFSKEKYEDEFSEQIRFKSFSYAFLTFLAFAGVFGAASIGRIDSVYIQNNQFIQIMIGLSLLACLTYFYYTKYKFKRVQES